MRRKLLQAGLAVFLAVAAQLPLVAAADLSFTTQGTWRIMGVPLYHQIHGLDCEAAALQEALGYQGIQVSQDQILSAMGIDWRGPTWDSAGNMHWGDPYAAFVGNPDGAERLLTGYGVYYPPTVRAAQQFGGSVVQSGEGISPATVYQALLNGNPVETWVSFDWRFHQVTHYVAYDGRTVQFGSPYEHSVTLAGVTNDAVLVKNPWFGEQWIDKATFEASYATFNDMAIVFAGPAGHSSMPSASSTAVGTPTPTDVLHPLTPARIVDTRDGTGGVPAAPLGPGATLNVQVAGQGGVPASGASSVVANVTVTGTTQMSFLSVYPSGSPRPSTSSLNWRSGQTVANLVQVPLSPDGKLAAFNLAGSAHLIIDVAGWFGPPSAATDGLFNALTPSRLLDTRNGTGGRLGALGAGQAIGLQVAGQGGVPAAGAAAVELNVTVTNPSAASYLTVFPAGSARPGVSNVNFVAGQTTPNRVIVALGSGGQLSLYNAAGLANVIVDVNGWFTDASAGGHGSKYAAMTPQRVLDTRGGGFGQVPPGGIAVSQVGDPSMLGVTAMVLNATATLPTAASFMVFWPEGAGRPLASDLNYVAGQTVPNLVTVKLGTNNGFDFYNPQGSVHVILDLVGYYGPVT